MASTAVVNNVKEQAGPVNLLPSMVVGAALAALFNLTLLVLARGLEVPLAVSPNGDPAALSPLTAGKVVTASVVPALLAASTLWLLRQTTARPFRNFVLVSLIALVLSFAGPLGQPVPTASRTILVLMHVAAAGAIVWSLTRRLSRGAITKSGG